MLYISILSKTCLNFGKKTCYIFKILSKELSSSGFSELICEKGAFVRAIVRQYMKTDIVESTGNANLRTAISEAVKAGELKKLVANIYTSSMAEQAEDVVKRNLFSILGMLFRGALISHRSALEDGPSNGNIILTYKYSKKVRLPGITVHLIQGPGNVQGDIAYADGLYKSSEGRAWLENLQQKYAHGFKRTISRTMLTHHLDNYRRKNGDGLFKKNLSSLNSISLAMGMEKEMKALELLADVILNYPEI